VSPVPAVRRRGPPGTQVGPRLLRVRRAREGRGDLTGDRLAAQLEVAAPADEEFVERSYALVLRRSPEPEARARALLKLAEGTLSRATLLHELATATEFERVRLLDDAIAFARGARGRGERPRRLQAPPGVDERAIEIPWVLARLGRGRVLDVGYANAEAAYVAALLAADVGELVGVDLATAVVPGMTTVQADIRSLPFEKRTFDQVLLVSTLEHVDADTTVYGVEADAQLGGRREALRELRRVLRPGGRLLVTVPLGEPGDHGWFRLDDIRGWSRLWASAGFFVEEQEAYELTGEGWRAAPTFSTVGVGYGDRGPAASAVLCAELSPRRLRRQVTPDGVRRTLRRRLGPAWRRAHPVD
jgi:SAM-dependent methyltransferase